MKFPCVGQVGSDCSPEMLMERKIFRAERKMSSPSTTLINSAELNSSLNVFWFASSAKFVSAIFLCDEMRSEVRALFTYRSFKLGGTL